ncbi:hypothetical protein [Cardinium endosymbiont of Tipula unca]|uniref:hypothetical protein n=1 Tax=Cardinium endosymbiont of Tipula unca TaxID=3066216 RepID=UPI0030D46EAD
MLFCSIKGANRGYIQVLLATSRNRIYFRRRSILYAALGGARSVAMTDVFQFLCFGCALPIIGYLLLRYAKIPLADGWAYFKQLPATVYRYGPHIFSIQEFRNKALRAIVALFSMFSPLAIQRFYMAKSVQQSQKVVLAYVAARAYVYLSMFCLAVLLYLGGACVET